MRAAAKAVRGRARQAGQLALVQASVVVGLLLAALAFPSTNASAQASFHQPSPAHGTVDSIHVHGVALEGNLLGDTADPHVSVYLPPGYATHPAQRYPVLYFLHGFTGTDEDWFRRAPADPQDKRPLMLMPTLLDDAIAGGASRELILVIPNAYNAYHGSFYSTSSATGDWEGFIAHDLVGYIDAHYRTLATPASRGLAGHSMGGYGALRIGLRHPEVFSSVYALSPYGVIWGEDFMPTPEGPMPALDAIKTREQVEKLEFGPLGALAIAAAWSPNPQKPPLFLDLPEGTGITHLTTLARWDANLILPHLDQNLPAVRQLRAIAFDAGREDEFKSIPPGLVALDKALSADGVPHIFELFEGTHGSRLAERISTRVLPFFTHNLSFEPAVPTR